MNILSEARKIIAPEERSVKIGVIIGRQRDGRLRVQVSSGAVFTVSGSADIGDTVLFRDKNIVTRLETEAVRTYYI